MLNRKKRVTHIVLMLIIVLFTANSLSVPILAMNVHTRTMDFTDVSTGSWYYPYVKRLYEDFIINGVSYDRFAPEQSVAVSEVAALITRYLGLENTANQRRMVMLGNDIKGAKLWYSGYIQVIRELGILDDAYIARLALVFDNSGELIISSEADRRITAPITRKDMVMLIARSFEIQQTSKLRTNGLLPSEISGNGNEFITGGGYDLAVFDYIAANRIIDFYDIPEDYRIYFLKLVYNGIIGGDHEGRVLPYNNLRRSELARIIASVLYFDLRTADFRELPEASILRAEDFVISRLDGSRFLQYERAQQILREQAQGISASVSGENVNIKIEERNIIPKGFLGEIYVYRFAGEITTEIGGVNSAANTSIYFPREHNFTMAGGANPIGYIYLVLRDLTRGGEVAGALILYINADGSLREASSN